MMGLKYLYTLPNDAFRSFYVFLIYRCVLLLSQSQRIRIYKGGKNRQVSVLENEHSKGVSKIIGSGLLQ